MFKQELGAALGSTGGWSVGCAWKEDCGAGCRGEETSGAVVSSSPLLTRLWSVQVIDVLHPNRASVPKEELKEKLAKTYKVGASARACASAGAADSDEGQDV